MIGCKTTDGHDSVFRFAGSPAFDSSHRSWSSFVPLKEVEFVLLFRECGCKSPARYHIHYHSQHVLQNRNFSSCRTRSRSAFPQRIITATRTMSTTFTDFAIKHFFLPNKTLAVATWLIAIGIALAFRLVYWRLWTSPLRNLRGPDGGTGPAGHYIELLE